MDSVKNDTESSDYASCTRLLEKSMKSNKKIQRLVDLIQSLGCELPSSFLACRRCDGQFTGGFTMVSSLPSTSSTATGSSATSISSMKPQIIMCQNRITDSESFEQTITHELIHAYDVCRAKINFEDCVQHACTEIRASSLSGECGLVPEAMRGHVQFKGGLEACTRRRAILSVAMNPSCGQKLAPKAVDKAFLKCYGDLSPFDDES